MFKMMERKDNVIGEFDRRNSLVYQARAILVSFAKNNILASTRSGENKARRVNLPLCWY